FFFFQAEDGIRYYKVTGVQTCALPISRGSCRTLAGALERAGIGGEGPGRIRVEPEPPRGAFRPPAAVATSLRPSVARHPRAGSRSEERRVGKAGRGRRAAAPATL